MTTSNISTDLGLVVRSVPYHQRSPRTQLDVALAASVMECSIEIYFLGPALYQLVTDKDPSAARLAPGMRGWNSLPGLTDVRFFAQSDWLDHVAADSLSVSVLGLEMAGMRERWTLCRRILSL